MALHSYPRDAGGLHTTSLDQQQRLLGSRLASEEENASGEYQQSGPSTIQHHGESSEHSSPASKDMPPVAHSSQYSTHPSLVHHNSYENYYTTSTNNNNNSASHLVAISSTGQLINNHGTPTVVQYAAAQPQVTIFNIFELSKEKFFCRVQFC